MNMQQLAMMLGTNGDMAADIHHALCLIASSVPSIAARLETPDPAFEFTQTDLGLLAAHALAQQACLIARGREAFAIVLYEALTGEI